MYTVKVPKSRCHCRRRLAGSSRSNRCRTLYLASVCANCKIPPAGPTGTGGFVTPHSSCDLWLEREPPRSSSAQLIDLALQVFNHAPMMLLYMQAEQEHDGRWVVLHQHR